MNKDDKERWDKLEAMANEIRVAIVGNADLGLKGLVERQADDEKFQAEIKQELTGIQSSLRKLHSQQKSTTELQTELDDRVKKVEVFSDTFQAIWKNLKPRKKTIAWIVGLIASLISGLAMKWEDISTFFKH